MKNIILFVAMLLLITTLGNAQSTNSKADTSVHYWYFSKEQLKIIAQIAFLNREKFVICYIDGKQFTQQGKGVTPNFSDAVLIKKEKLPFQKKMKETYVVYPPDDFKTYLIAFSADIK